MITSQNIHIMTGFESEILDCCIPLAGSQATAASRKKGSMLRKKASSLSASKCPGCGAVYTQSVLEQYLYVCPGCKHYLSMPSSARIELLADHATFRELDRALVSVAPLAFVGL